MSVDVTIKDEQDAVDILTYNYIQLERSVGPNAAFSLVASIPLVSGQVYYPYTDPNGSLNSWYHYRLYNSNTSAASAYSNAFRPDGATRQKLRQQALSDYQAGTILTASASGHTLSRVVAVPDYIAAGSIYRTTRGKGSWIYPLTGPNAFGIVRVDNTDPVAGYFNTTPPWGAAPIAGDLLEWHWLVSPDEWNLAINRAMRRYEYLDRVPIKGIGSNEIPLTFLPWLTNTRKTFGLWYYPSTTDIEAPWGTMGRWWGLRQENNNLTLITSPALAVGDTVYLDTLRPMPEVFTDNDVLPTSMNLDLASALAYDEALASLTRPAHGAASVDRNLWTQERIMHQRRLRSLLEQNKPHPRPQSAQFESPNVVPHPWRSR